MASYVFVFSIHIRLILYTNNILIYLFTIYYLFIYLLFIYLLFIIY